ncbi:transposase, partial [Streptomyces sp. SP17KL33]|nr:transposase [Streptomyces sp. SP17KL33]
VADRAIAYSIHYDTGRDRLSLTASWQTPPPPAQPIEAALAHRVIRVDKKPRHQAAWRVDNHRNPTGIAVIADYPANTSRRLPQHWQQHLISTNRKTKRHE